jgi:hypothetical protein
MKQENEKMDLIETSQNTTEKPTRKGVHKYFHVSRLDTYISVVAALVFAVLGFLELLNFANITFIKVSNSFQFAILIGIYGLVSSMYYKLFEEKYDKKK